ncbi:putative adenylyl-sulfate kinase [Candidatus Burarchaeum australiense]|nr:putative adenylyl-sulfate kinase [Candidatus Burarchaeum australiense]
MRAKHGLLVWITGLAGTGKTLLAEKVYTGLCRQRPNTVHLDGDVMRTILGEHGHSLEDRKKTARIYARLAAALTRQGITVVVSTISLFHEIHAYNAKNNARYVEVLLRVDEEELLRRNKKLLYTRGRNVMGIHQRPEFPKRPALVLENNTRAQLSQNARKILTLSMRK